MIYALKDIGRKLTFILLLFLAPVDTGPQNVPVQDIEYLQCEANPASVRPCEPSQLAVRLIQRWEGYVPVLYKDSAGKWTIGFGHLVHAHEREHFSGRGLTPAEADSLFLVDLREHSESVNKYVSVPLWQWQYDALTSFVYNVGGPNFAASTLREYVNEERHEQAADEFLRWVYVSNPKRKLRGLVKRRQAESNLYALAR